MNSLRPHYLPTIVQKKKGSHRIFVLYPDTKHANHCIFSNTFFTRLSSGQWRLTTSAPRPRPLCNRLPTSATELNMHYYYNNSSMFSYLTGYFSPPLQSKEPLALHTRSCLQHLQKLINQAYTQILGLRSHSK